MRATHLGLLLTVLATTPAFAQRVDTRRNTVVIRADHVATCRFNAIPALELHEYPLTASTALLTQPVSDAPTGTRVDLVMRYAREPGLPFGTRSALLRIHIDGVPNVRKLRLSAGGEEIALLGALDTNPAIVMRGVDRWTEIPAERQSELAARIASEKSIQADLLDGSDRVIGRYHWDTHRLDGIPELLDLVHWGCTNPDRG
jgi:hypothetical protein